MMINYMNFSWLVWALKEYRSAKLETKRKIDNAKSSYKRWQSQADWQVAQEKRDTLKKCIELYLTDLRCKNRPDESVPGLEWNDFDKFVDQFENEVYNKEDRSIDELKLKELVDAWTIPHIDVQVTPEIVIPEQRQEVTIWGPKENDHPVS